MILIILGLEMQELSPELQQRIQDALAADRAHEEKKLADAYSLFRSKYRASGGRYLPVDITSSAKISYAFAVPEPVANLVQAIGDRYESDIILRLQAVVLDDLLMENPYARPEDRRTDPELKDLLWLLGLGYRPSGPLLDNVLIPLSNLYTGEITPELVQAAVSLFQHWFETVTRLPDGVRRYLVQTSELQFVTSEAKLIRTVSLLLQKGLLSPEAVRERGYNLIRNWAEFATPEEIAKFRTLPLGGMLPQ
jgi:hypothetical protein